MVICFKLYEMFTIMFFVVVVVLRVIFIKSALKYLNISTVLRLTNQVHIDQLKCSFHTSEWNTSINKIFIIRTACSLFLSLNYKHLNIHKNIPLSIALIINKNEENATQPTRQHVIRKYVFPTSLQCLCIYLCP